MWELVGRFQGLGLQAAGLGLEIGVVGEGKRVIGGAFEVVWNELVMKLRLLLIFCLHNMHGDGDLTL